MLILHIADIHFEAPICLSPDTDPERPFRTALVADLRIQVKRMGAIDAILIGGDIAYKGDPLEYGVALEWIKELAEAAKCPIERVFVVPGNHDVDRRANTVPAVRNAQRSIAKAPQDKREKELRENFSDGEAGQSLLSSLEAYNKFAAHFDCQIYSPDKLFWKQSFPIRDDVTLMLHGLTSTILSGMEGGNDTKLTLYLSPLQTAFNPVEGVVNMVLCHHPPDWFMDQDDIEDSMNGGRALIQFFGHKHRQRVLLSQNYVKFSAGAVNPDRYEQGWQPGYNIVEVEAAKYGMERGIQINAHMRQWQGNPDMFRPILTPDGETVFTQWIRLPDIHYVAPLVVPAREAQTPPDSVDVGNDATEGDVDAAMSTENSRNLVFRFWNLASSQRREIALQMGLIVKTDMVLPEPERYGRALRLAAERGLLEVLGEEIKKRER